MKTELNVLQAPQSVCCPIEEIAPADAEELAGTAAVFKALSDPTRLRILRVISHMDQLCECNIVPVFGLSQPTISYHLKVLREAGLITSQRRGQWVWHRVNDRALLSAVRTLSEVVE
jgi:ArsR family transcriptional regulator